MAEPDDFPERSWVLIRLPKGDRPGAVRLRRFLKVLGRRYDIDVERVDVVGPTADGGNGNAEPRASSPPSSPTGRTE